MLGRIGLASVLTATCLFAGSEFRAGPDEPIHPDHIVVKVRPGSSIQRIISTFAPQAAVALSATKYSYYVLSVPPQLRQTLSTQISQDLMVEFVEPNRIRKSNTLAMPNDGYYSQQWALQTMQALKAWNLIPSNYLTASTAGTGRIKVAVLDTGADCTHPDFMNAGGTSTDSAAGGQLMRSLSQALVTTTIASPACPWQDDYGHGTHVAGIIAAATNNQAGVASIGYPLQLIIYKILDNNGAGSDSDIAQAIMNATDAGAQVVSLSLGGGGYSQLLQTALNYAWQRNVLVVAAAGNGGSSALVYPGDGLFAMGIAATDQANNRASFSSFGNGVGLAAPGVGILSTLPTYAAPIGGTNYGQLSGTSMATPAVAGVAGLLAMVPGSPSAAAIAQRLQQSAANFNLNGGWDQYLGYGVVNAYSALAGILHTATAGSITGQVLDGTGTPITGANVTIGSSTTSTTEGGLFRLPNLSAGSYTMTVTASGFTNQTLGVTIPAGADARVAVTMGVNYGRFSGHVYDNGAAVSGIIVQAISAGLITATTTTDSSGSYQFSVPAGTYQIQASALSYNAASVTGVSITAGSTKTVDIPITALGTISGVVRDGTTQQLLSGVVVKFTGASFQGGAITDVNGAFKSFGLPSGVYTVTADLGQTVATVSNITVSTDFNTVVNLSLTPGGASVLPVFGTGVTSPGVLAPDGSVDAHYTIISSADPSSPGPNAYLPSSTAFPIGPWLSNGPNSKWIAPKTDQGTGNSGGYYTYRTTFSLAGFNPTTAILKGGVAADNAVTIQLNGATVATSTGFYSLTPFTVNSGFISGTNTLDFVVYNDGAGPTGLRVDLSGTAATGSATPSVAVSVSPKTTTLGPQGQQPFTVTVTGSANTAVTWTLTPNVGTMTGNTYTAPSTISATQTVTAKAVSQADGVTFDTATITLNPPAAPGTISVFGTGVTSPGVLAADGSVDAHYTIISSADPSSPGPNAYLPSSTAFPIGPWLSNGPNSKWIAPKTDQGTGNSGGYYTYRTTFSLTGLNPATAVLKGGVAADNAVTIQLNGVTVFTNTGFYSLAPFTINSGFLPGTNTLDFVVFNDGAGPTGLRVDLSGTATTGSSGSSVAVSVSPKTTTLGPQGQQPFTVTVTGSANTAVTWTLTPNVGTMTGNTYTAPTTISATQTVTAKAVSQADGVTFDTATITLNPPAAPGTISVFGTGVTSPGVLAADGSVDAHYTIISSADPSSPGPNAYLPSSTAFPMGPWIYNGPNSKWIAPKTDQGTGNSGGYYTYRTTFSLTGFNPATAILKGGVAADNSVTIKLNGATVFTSTGFNSLAAFTINTGFVAGTNTLDFVVYNDGAGPTGLRVDLSGTVSP